MTEAKRALIVRGGWPGHQPVEATDAVTPFLKSRGFEVRIEESPEVYADSSVLTGIDLIVQCVTMGKLAPKEFEGLASAVHSGVGFSGWHGGIVDSYRETPEYLQLVGGQFVKHPQKPAAERVGDASDNLVDHTIEITEIGRGHAITQGLESFDLVTEQYWVLTDEYNDVLATTTHPSRPGDAWNRPVTCPAVWTRQWGLGRVFVATPGHSVDTLEDPSVRTIVERGLLWASR